MPREQCSGDGVAKAILPDGSRVTIRDVGLRRSLKLKVGRSKPAIELLRTQGCISFSRNWKQLLVHGGEFDAPIEVYDFEKARKTGKLAGAEIGKLKGEFASAVFSGDDLVTARDRAVQRWRQSGTEWVPETIFQNEYPIHQADLDETGRKLLVVEDVSHEDLRGFLYSLAARQRWVEVGKSWRWLRATFAKDGRIVVSHLHLHNVERVLRLPTLRQLTGEAEQVLQPRCRVDSARDYRRSVCWPVAFKEG